jgi:excisionase family DNA binding protein
MSIEIDGQVYYRTSEACKKIGVSRATLFRWLKAGVLDQHRKDRRGWRIFREEDLKKISAEARKIRIEYVYPGGKIDKA